MKLSKRDESRLTILEECEYDIRRAFQAGLEATRTIGDRLLRIKEEELFRERSDTWSEYIENYHDLNVDVANRLVRRAKSVRLIEEHGLPLPASWAQVDELCKVEPERQIEIWQRVLNAVDKDELITAKTVQIAVRLDQRSTSQQSKPGIEVPDLDLDDEQEKQSSQPSEVESAVNNSNRKPQEAPVRLSERAEAALERIGRLCGDVISDGILEHRIPISENELIRWGEESDDIVLKLKRYVAELGWSVSKALRFEDKTITTLTPIGRLIELARARGGRYQVELDSFEVRLSPVAA